MLFKRELILFLLITSSLLMGSNIYAQNISNKGTEFWVGYGHHQFMESGQSNSQEMVLYLSAEQAATVKVTIFDTARILAGTAWTRTYNIPANTVIASDLIPKSGTYDARLITLPCSFVPVGTPCGGEGKFSNRAIHITSNVPIVAYAHIFGSASSGATMLIPVEAYGYAYTSINSKQEYDVNCFSWMYVIANHDSTIISVTPSVATRTGNAANIPFTLRLNRGEIYQMMAGPEAGSQKPELTGTKVKSIANSLGECYPIAVFSGSSRTANPAACGRGGGDNDNQQCFPSQSWGKRYLTAPTSNSTTSSNFMTNTYKIVVKDPATVVKRNGVVLTGIINNSYYTFESNQPEYIESDIPIMMAQFMTGGCALGTPGTLGDPEMMFISPMEQGIQKVGFYRNNREAIDVNYLTLVIPTAGVASLRIDGSSVFSYTMPHPRLAGYTIVVKRWTAAQAQATASSDSVFTAITYGLGSVESYGYNAGTFVNNLHAVSSIRNVEDTSSVKSHIFTCYGSPVTISALFSYQPQKLVWKLSEMGLSISPNADVTDNSPILVDSVYVNGIKYYKYTLPGQYIFYDTGSVFIPIYATHPSIENCNFTERITIEIKVQVKPTIDFTSTILTSATSGCILDTLHLAGANISGVGLTFSQWTWAFPDGVVGQNKDTIKLFSTPGVKSIKLTGITTEGCVGDTTKDITIYDKPLTSISSNLPSICGGGSLTFTPNTTYGDPTALNTWYWDFANGQTIAATSSAAQTISYPNYGTYIIKQVSGVSAACVSDTAFLTINIYANPNVSFGYPAGCLPANGVVQFTSASSTPDGQAINNYSWNFADANATIANPNTSTIANPSHLYAVGNYSISFNATTDKGCFKDTIVNTSFNLKPSLAFGSIAPICGSAATISVANGSVTNGVPGTGSYGGPGTDAAGNFNPIIAGAGLHTIWYYYTTTGGCRDSISQTIQVRAKPTVAFGYTNPVCLATNGLVQFTNSSSVSDGQTISYNWDFNDPFANAGNSNTSTLITPSHNFGEGVFNIKLSATTNFGCVNDTTIPVTFSVKPSLAFAALNTVCESDGTTSIALATITNGLSGSGFYSGNGVSPAGSFNPSVAGPGNQAVKYIFTTVGGCIDSIPQSILVNPKPTAAFTATNSICQNQAATITDASSISSGNIITWNWYFTDGTNNTVNNTNPYTHSFPSFGSYTVKLVAISNNNCISDTAYQTVNVHALPIANFNPPPFVCMPNGTASFQNTSVAPDNAALSYQWDFGDGLTGSNAANPSHIYITTPVSININLTATSSFGCISDSIKTLSTFYDKPIADFTVRPTDLCQGITNYFTDNSTAPNGTITNWNWNFGDGSTHALTQNPTHKYINPGVYQIILIVKNQVGCESDPFPSIVTVNIQPQVDAGWSFVVPEGTVIRLAPIVNDSTSVSYLWTPQGDIIDPTVLRPVFRAMHDQTYTLTGTGSGNCSASDTMHVKVLKPFTIPNVFSPNGDNINDTWVIKYLNDYPGAKIDVYNRYGQVVYSSVGYATPWDGTYKGKPLPVATYYYIIKPRNEFEPLTGSITIVR